MQIHIRTTIAAVLVLGILAGCAAPAATPTPGAGPTPAAQPPASSIADGVVLPERSVELEFELSGTVVEVLVEEGARVEAGVPLARLDTVDLELQVAQSEASLAQAQAGYDKLAAGATAEEIAAQAALLRNAEAGLQRARTSNTTAADIASAEAQVRSAQARLDDLKAQPKPEALASAQAAYDQAVANLAAQRTSLAVAKERAASAVQQAADTLRNNQDSYSRIYWENRELEKLPGDLPQRNIDNEAAALRAVASSEESLQQARLAYEQTQQDEISGLARAESQLADAEVRLRTTREGASEADLIQAQASVDQARASLQKLRQGGTAADVAASEASVAQAQANLERLTTPPRAVDLAEAQGRIEAAQVALQQAERTLAQATLRAPFAGIIAERNLEVGQKISTGAGGGAAPFILADIGTWKIETDNLSERDVVRIQVGSPAEVSFEALPGVTVAGVVSAIKPRGVDRFGDMTYTVTVTLNEWDERLRWNMSASVAIKPSP